MRIAILSDIHGNIWALKAVLEDIKKQDIDLTVNAGDILSGPLDPAATADLLMALDLPTIRGNHERQLLACAQKPGAASDQFAFEHTSTRHHDWIRGLPATLTPAPDVFMCHGTPASDLVYFLEEVDEHGTRLARQSEIGRYAEGINHSLIICGHSHIPRTCALADGRLVVNPGSVGLQAYDDDHPFYHVMENGSPHARYAICQRIRQSWSVAHHCVEYDSASAVAAAVRNGRLDWAQWLETGRASHPD